MDAPISVPVDVKAALIAAYQLSTAATARIPGDIPSLLAHAYSRHFHENMHSIRNAGSHSPPADTTMLESLIAMLSEIPPLAPTAQVLLDRARSILADGPPLSMNIELAEGEELPVALHTLNQGTLWAILMASGATPDLEDSVLANIKQNEPFDAASLLLEDQTPDGSPLLAQVSGAQGPEAKRPWMLCKKFLFRLNVANRDCESYEKLWFGLHYQHHRYMGRLLMRHCPLRPSFIRARMPRALEVYSDEFTHIARTPKGLWGWGNSSKGQLGFMSDGFVDPTRLTFPLCPKVAELEAGLAPWAKHQFVTAVSLCHGRTFILTPRGTVMAGSRSTQFTGSGEHLFHPVAVPPGFVPDRIIQCSLTVILSMGDQQLISGENRRGRLGLGHDRTIRGFEVTGVSVDRVIIAAQSYCIFAGSRQLFFAGAIPRLIRYSGLLPGLSVGDVCPNPTPLRFRARVTGFLLSSWVVWVSEGITHAWRRSCLLSAPFEATAFGGSDRCFRNQSGQSFKAYEGGRVACMREDMAPDRWEDIIPVDVDPWSPSQP
ncbi:2 5-diketo-D-gluconic acid reductase [Carpediemonas membranifera]|uniref:2 5-diketo-D-gluconic acid reductase n=1 Tax=Carpediemonas membranifera TaxID=201153 RepID=A0A8J6AVW9_9EUKA|nr:2 5-diketo-D-gluconic acid reductase [Carpediemonas membranifera]|eukprot:KAG9396121.1 2 5-diketo-D-gluconic acid reductase [Carpediemonas membranifera]